MTSTNMMIGLVGFYIVTAGVSAYELNWSRCFYWIGAAIITSAVLQGTR